MNRRTFFGSLLGLIGLGITAKIAVPVESLPIICGPDITIGAITPNELRALRGLPPWWDAESTMDAARLVMFRNGAMPDLRVNLGDQP